MHSDFVDNPWWGLQFRFVYVGICKVPDDGIHEADIVSIVNIVNVVTLTQHSAGKLLDWITSEFH